MPPKAKPKAKIGRASKVEIEGDRKNLGGSLLGSTTRKSRGAARGPSKFSSSEQSTPLLAAPDNDAPSRPSEIDADTQQSETLQSPASASHQAPRRPKRKAQPKPKQHDQKVDGADERCSLFDVPAEDPEETTATIEHVDPSHKKAVPKKKIVRKQKTQAGESGDAARISLPDQRLSTVPKPRASDPGPRRAHPRPFLAGLSPQKTNLLSPGDGDNSEDLKNPGAKKKSATGRVSIKRPSALSVRTQQVLGARQTEARVPQASLTFRFLNYNMANRTDANLDDVAVGFQELQRARTQVIAPLSQSDGTPSQSNTTEDCSFVKKAEDVPMIGSMSQKLPTEHRNLAKLLLEGAQCESIFVPEKDLGPDVGRRQRLSTEFDVVDELQNLSKVPPKKDPELAQKSRSSQNVEAKSPNTEAKSQKKVIKFVSADVRDLDNEANKEKNGKTNFQNQSAKMMSTTSIKSMASTASGKSTRPAPKKKSLFRSFTRKATTRRGTLLQRSMNVDCIFGVLCETQFPLEEMAEVMNEEVVNGECHTLSAQQMVNEQGAIAGVRGYAAATWCGDLKTITMIRENMGEGSPTFVETGKTISPCDDKGNNPMKSFLVRSFDVECPGTGEAQTPKLGKLRTLRILCVGSHFPMKKVASLMQEQEASDDNVLQQTKYMLAKLLKKALHHLLEEEKLSKNSIVLLQGDLNSRCVLHGGRFLDIIWETLHDHNLQQYISMGLPSELRGEWREVVKFEASGELPVTYRFDQKQSASVARGNNLQLREVFGDAEESTTSYRNVLETIQSNGILKDWGLYNQKLDDESKKFKPSRLPACTERVLYYAPANLGDCCWWSSSEGYEVNYLQTGSDHRPVVLEATLNIGRRRESSRAMSTFDALGGLAPEEIEKAIGDLNLQAEESENTSESDEEGSARKRTALRLSIDGDMTLIQTMK